MPYPVGQNAPCGRKFHKRTVSRQMVHDMTKAQLELLARMLRDGQAKLVERNGKLVPVSLI